LIQQPDNGYSVEGGIDPFRHKALYPYIQSWLHRYPIPKHGQAVDLCCGQGASTTLLSKAYPDNEVTAFDYSLPLIRRAKELYPGNNPLFFVADAGNVPLPSTAFGRILCINSIFHLPPETLLHLLHTMRRIAVPNAKILVTTVNPESYNDFAAAFHDPQHSSSPSSLGFPDSTPWLIGNPEIAGTKQGETIILGPTPFYMHTPDNLKFAINHAGLRMVGNPDTLGSLTLVGGQNRDLFSAFTLAPASNSMLMHT